VSCLFAPLLATLSQSASHTPLGLQAHAVKSAALSLGYFRLAALMGEIEHARSSYLFATYPQNGKIIMELLNAVQLDTKNAA